MIFETQQDGNENDKLKAKIDNVMSENSELKGELRNRIGAYWRGGVEDMFLNYYKKGNDSFEGRDDVYICLLLFLFT